MAELEPKSAALEPLGLPPEEIDAEIDRLIAPGLRANAWRPDFEAMRQRRLHDEDHQGWRVRMLRRAMPGLRRKRILDLGTGRAGLAVALRREGYSVVALDLRRNNCRVAALRAARFGLALPAVAGAGERLPFRGQSFGLVVCRDVLEHCQQPERLLREIWRVLRRGGASYVTVINRLCWVDPHYHLAGLSFLPRALAERYIAWRGRAKTSQRDRQRLSEMHYFVYADFVRLARALGFAVRDLEAERLEAARAGGWRPRLRSLRHRLLRPLSLQGNHFELLLSKPRLEAPR